MEKCAAKLLAIDVCLLLAILHALGTRPAAITIVSRGSLLVI